MVIYRRTFGFSTLPVVLFFLFALTSFAFAQDATPIQIEQNVIGDLTADAPTAVYALTARGGETALVQVLALSPGFVPRFRVVNPAGVEILAAPNVNTTPSVTANVAFADAGVYTIEVASENETRGQSVLSLQAGTALPAALDLGVDQLVSGTVGRQTRQAIYRFNTGLPNAAVLTILSETLETGVLISLYDETAGRTLATSDAGVSGIAFRLPPGDHDYRVELRASSMVDTPYTICLGACAGSLLTSATPEITISPSPEVVTSPCAIAASASGSINIRSGPGTQYAIIGSLAAEQTAPVNGRLADGSWYQISLNNGVAGWVAASVTRLDGDCAALSVVTAPSNAPLAPTNPPPTNPPPTVSSGGGGIVPTLTSAPPAAPTTVPPPVFVLPDIQVAVDPSSYYADNVVGVSVNVTVVDAPVVGEFTIELCVDNSCINLTRTSPGIGVFRIDRNFSDSLLDPRRVTHQIRATVDAFSQIAESNETNNVATRSFQ